MPLFRRKIPDRLHVLHLVEYLELGGIERMLEQLARHTPEPAARLSFFVFRSREIAGIGQEIRAMGRAVHTWQTGRFDFRLLLTLRRLVRREKIGVVHTHDLGPMLYAAALKILCPRLRLVHTHHTLLPLVDVPKYRAYFGVLTWFYSAVVGVSEFVLTRLKEACPHMARHNALVVANGVDTRRYDRHDARVAGEPLRLVSVSRLHPLKNIHFLVEAGRRLRGRGIDFHLDHAGAGDAACREQLEKQVREAGLEEHVTFHGFMTDVQPLLSRSHAFVSASLLEGHPVAVLEAMSCGLPCLLSDINPHRFAGDAGFFFDVRRVESLTDLLASLHGQPERFEAGARLGRSMVREQYSINHLSRRYLEVYDPGRRAWPASGKGAAAGLASENG